MKLSGNFIAQSPYKGKSKFRFWQNIVEGDIINISIDIQSYNTDMKLYCEFNNRCAPEKFSCSINQLANYLNQITIIQQESFR